MPAKKIKTNHAARSFKTKTNKDMLSHRKSRNRGTDSEFPRGDGGPGRPKTRGRPMILLGQDMIGHIGFFVIARSTVQSMDKKWRFGEKMSLLSVRTFSSADSARYRTQ